MRYIYIVIIIFTSFVFFSCNQSENPKGKWLNGSGQDNIERIEEHFRGFGVAMFEIGYRYQELYWALSEENWEYADHQVHEIEETIELALERRAERRKSATHFLNVALPEMEDFIKKKNSDGFELVFQNLTSSCNTCHAMEQMPFIYVQKPENRLSPVRKIK